MPVMGVPKFERFFRVAAGLDVSKNDLKRYNDFVDAKLYDLFLIGTADAKANDRDIIEPQDLPVTKGMQESIHAFKKLEEGIELRPLLDDRSPASDRHSDRGTVRAEPPLAHPVPAADHRRARPAPADRPVRR